MHASPYGFGLRTRHYPQFLADGVGVGWVEAITENFLGRGGRPAAVLERVRRDADVALHGVSLSIGGLDPLPVAYLGEVRELARRIDAALISDHLCFGTFGGRYGHDLWPMPYTEEAVRHVVARVTEVQDRLGVRIALENVSSYVEYAASEMTEWEFLREVATRADAWLLVDVNNVHVSAENHGFDARTYLDGIPKGRVAQYHLAGHSVRDGYLFDDHGRAVSDPVWDLYGYAVARLGEAPTVIEWDENVPALDELVRETEKARAVASRACLEVAS